MTTGEQTSWSERLLGNDPYDALLGMRVPEWVKQSARARQMLIQLRKRSPIDLGPIYGVAPFVMAKSAGVELTAQGRRAAGRGGHADCIELAELTYRTEGWLGEGRWGYEFDVQTRWAFYPRRSPNLIATVFCARGFGVAGIALSRTEWTSELLSASHFITSQLLVTEGERRWFSYVPDSTVLVHNANLLGAGLVASASALEGDEVGLAIALSAAWESIRAQTSAGGWPYGAARGLEWEDSFHTAYSLDGLLQIWLATRDPDVESALKIGVEYWAKTFIGPKGQPWYGPEARFPLDIHSAGTAIDVGARLASWGLLDRGVAERVARWTRGALIDPRTGRAWYQQRRLFTDKRHFPRWGQAHLDLGEASLAMMTEGRRCPLEVAVWESCSLRKVPEATHDAG